MRRAWLLFALSLSCAGTKSGTPPRGLRVLLYTQETDWRHPSNPEADRAMQRAGTERGWTLKSTKNPAIFTSAELGTYDVVVFLVTSGITMNQAQRDGFVSWFGQGRGWVGVHSAVATDHDWSHMTGMAAAQFKTHPTNSKMPGKLIIEDPKDRIVAHLPNPWPHADEWYVFAARPEENKNLHLLLSLDEASTPELPAEMRMGKHPLAWRQDYAGGHAFYTALGHNPETYADDAFVRHVVAGIEWAGAESRTRHP